MNIGLIIGIALPFVIMIGLIYTGIKRSKTFTKEDKANYFKLIDKAKSLGYSLSFEGLPKTNAFKGSAGPDITGNGLSADEVTFTTFWAGFKMDQTKKMMADQYTAVATKGKVIIVLTTSNPKAIALYRDLCDTIGAN